MKEDIFALQSDVCAAEGPDTGVARRSQTKYARNGHQAALLCALLSGSCSLEDLQTVLSRCADPPCGEAAAALEIAAFILDFKDYLKS